MTNNKADKGFIVKTAATYVGFAAAPFVIALTVSSVFTPPVEASGYYPFAFSACYPFASDHCVFPLR